MKCPRLFLKSATLSLLIASSFVNARGDETAVQRKTLAFTNFTAKGLSAGRHLELDDMKRYSHQLQSYLAEMDVCAVLSAEETEQRMKNPVGILNCSSKKCALNIGKSLGVDYMGFGSLRKVFGTFTINICIVDVEQETTLVSEKRRFGGKETVFYNEIIPQIAYKIGGVLEQLRRSERHSSPAADNLVRKAP